MATVALTPETVGKPGGSELSGPTYNSIATGNTYTWRNSRRVMLHFKKSGAGNATITFTTPATVGGLAVADPTITVPASTGDVMVSPASLPGVFNDSGGLGSFSTDEGTGLTCAVVEID